MKDFLLIALPTLILSIAVSLGITILFRVIKEKNKEKLARELYERAMKETKKTEWKETMIKKHTVYSWENLKKLLKEIKEPEFLETITAYNLPANEYKKLFEDNPVADEMFKQFGESKVRVDFYYESKDYVYFEVRKEQESERERNI